MWTISLLLDDVLNDNDVVVNHTSSGIPSSSGIVHSRRTDDVRDATGIVTDATQQQKHQSPTRSSSSSYIAICTCSISDLLGTENSNRIFNLQKEEPVLQRTARIALADYMARMITMRTITSTTTTTTTTLKKNISIRVEALENTTNRQSSSRRPYSNNNHNNNNNMEHDSKQQPTTATTITMKRKNSLLPYILERSDVTTTITTSNDDDDDDSNSNFQLHVYVRVFVFSDVNTVAMSVVDENNGNSSPNKNNDDDDDDSIVVKQLVAHCMTQYLDCTTSSNESITTTTNAMMTHIAIAVLQERIRLNITKHQEGGVAFIANGAILPRKSGASSLPMSCPPAIPFIAPIHENAPNNTTKSPLHQTVEIDMGYFTQFLVGHIPQGSNILNDTTIVLSGLLIPPGVALIVGGGYHGKSTLLRCIAAGVYNKILGDGREFCVTVPNAVTVRAEDGRYVNRCNVSAFIANLPIVGLDTKQFSTTEASGSTSQASNVVEAIEMGATAMLVDEDVSAANFMARDGRMRSLVMDESITPLLYRVNGLFRTHAISSIVVVGGVGDWLDVPDHVILMDRYQCHDATAKARSISKQFSHGHVQYAGRGVVHRLDWEKGDTPLPRRPVFSTKYAYDMLTTAVTLLDGSNSIAIHNITQLDTKINNALYIDDITDENDDENDDERYIDMSRCEQLLGKKPGLYGCGLCVAWILNYSTQHPELGIRELLENMDDTFDRYGWTAILKGSSPNETGNNSPAWRAVVERLGFVYRPRRFEVGQALTRFRGITFESIPIDDDGSDEAARLDAERRRNELLAIWNNRRKNNSH